MSSRSERSALPPGTTPAMHKPHLPPSGWDALQEHNRKMAEQEAYQARVETEGVSLRVLR